MITKIIGFIAISLYLASLSFAGQLRTQFQDGLIFAVHINEGVGSTVGGISGSRGSIVGAAWEKGIWGQSLKFANGTDHEVAFGTGHGIPRSLTSFTIEAAIKVFSYEEAVGGGCNTHTNCADDCNVIVSEAGQRHEFGITCLGNLYLDSGAGAGWLSILTSNGIVKKNEWTLVHVTGDGGASGTVNFYINGISTSTHLGVNTSFGGATAGALSIGTLPGGLNLEMTIDGNIDHVYEWNRALTPAEIKMRYFEWRGGTSYVATDN